jgi:16S rRNA (uracil1498-N3)-methyltransferase
VPYPRFFVPDRVPAASVVTLPADEAHHLTRVLRLGVNDVVAVFDGRGGEWLARIASAGRGGVTVELGAPVAPAVEPRVRVTLAVGLLKGDQMDDVIRDATMMGVDAIVPMQSAHVTVPERAWKGSHARDRWRRVAVASAKQCRRAVVPELSPVRAFADVIADVSAFSSGRFICLEPARQDTQDAMERSPVEERQSTVPAAALVLVGPEGGWSGDEAASALAAGFAPLRLGPRTIRAERAPLVALSALWSRWGW